jgi:hypothetical protein
MACRMGRATRLVRARSETHHNQHPISMGFATALLILRVANQSITMDDKCERSGLSLCIAQQAMHNEIPRFPFYLLRGIRRLWE